MLNIQSGKRLFFHLTIDTLNVYRVFLSLSISLEIIDITETVFVQVLVDSSTTRIFFNYSFVEKHCQNTHKLLKPILIYNINSILNKNSWISRVVNIILQYQLYSKQALLTVFSLEKHDLIFGFIWLKTYNFKINW